MGIHAGKLDGVAFDSDKFARDLSDFLDNEIIRLSEDIEFMEGRKKSDAGMKMYLEGIIRGYGIVQDYMKDLQEVGEYWT